MDWTNTLKRTRNGSIYSETASSLTKLRQHANKRRKTSGGSENPPSPQCYLEALPAELLQPIFLMSMNGNLLTASPRIAVKLSGTNAFYRAAFLLALYSHDVEKMFDIYKLHYLIPMLDLPLSSWDVRSMTRAVLNSRWCTWGQVERWLADSLEYAIGQLLAVAKPTYSAQQIDMFMQGETNMESLLGYTWWAEDEEKRKWQLETCMWDIRLVRGSDIDEDEMVLDGENREAYSKDPFTAEWQNELIFQCEMRLLGVLTFGDEKSFNSHLHHVDPFRKIIESVMGLDMQDLDQQASATDVWQLLDDRAVRASRNAHWLRETLAIQYFFYPEDQAFKVSPRLYRAAAIADLKLEWPIYTRRGSYVPVLHVLFEADPFSLPRTDPTLLAWTARARKRIVDFYDHMELLRNEVEHQREMRLGTLKTRDRNKYLSIKLEHKYRYEQDWKIINYITTGAMGDTPPNGLAPKFTEPLAWLGERLSPSPKALAEAENAQYPHASKREVDIFEDVQNAYPDFSVERYDLECETMKSIYDLWDRSRIQVEQEATFDLDKIATSEARYALTAYDGYYKSHDHDGYEKLFRGDGAGLEEEWDSDEDEEEWGYVETDSDDEEGDDMYSDIYEEDPAEATSMRDRGLLQERPIIVHRNLTGLDLHTLYPSEHFPVPSSDTELLDPLFAPPKWFHPAEAPYLAKVSDMRY